MNKIMQPEKWVAAISLVPESAPFSVEQRAWLNGFFAGMTGIEEVKGPSDDALFEDANASMETEETEDFPWKDESLTLDNRLQLATERPFKRQLMAAMAQLDCGSCGYVCQTYSEAIASGAESNLTLCSPGGKETARAIKKLIQLNGDAGGNAGATYEEAQSVTGGSAANGYSRSKPFAAKLIRSEKITGDGSAKDVRHVEIDLSGSGIEYRVGDALGIFPRNCETLVNDVLNRCQTNGSIDQTRLALLTRDLSTVTDELAEAISRRIGNETEQKRITALIAHDELLDELDVLDFLDQFPSSQIPDRELVDVLPPLNPRLYSIASSLKAHADQVHLTVGKVAYEHNNRLRKGVASTMLSDRIVAGNEVQVFVQPSHGFTIPANHSAPMIMVGPGTGIAPFVSFLQERDTTKATGKNWLFFGDQRSESDFLYRDRMNDYLERGVLTRLDTAFSRDQAEKIYVQDRMRQNAAELFRWLEDGANFYVCGDANRMAKDVDNALHEIIASQGQLSAAAAKEYVNKLKVTSRYCRDVY